MQENYLKLDLSKTKCMLIHPPRKPHLPPLHLSINGTTIEQVTKFKLLGLYINDTLSWNEHISQIVSKVSKQIYLLQRLSDFLPQSGLKAFYNSYILPTLSYCDIVWYSCTNAQINQLERLQNQAGRIILKRRRADSATKLRQDLNWPTLKTQRKLHLAQQVFKCKSNSAPSYLKNLLKSPTDVHQHFTRQSTSGYTIPSVKNEHGKKSFLYSAPTLWNSLPSEAKAAASLSTFTAACKSILSY